jgi:Zn-dependent metalloprotease
MTRTCRCLNCIMPPHMLKKLLESGDPEIRRIALNTLLVTSRLRGERSVRANLVGMAPPGHGRRTIFDCRKSIDLSSAAVGRSEDGAASSDASVNRAFDGFGKTRDFYQQIFDRDSIDDGGMRLDGYVHRGVDYNNAFWDGHEMVFGDGDQRLFTDFTKSLDVIAHELTHGVTEHTAGLEYHNQSGALNESISDVFGSLVKQWSLNQTADQADWLIGAEVFTPGIEGDALRSLKDPGNAYNDPQLGKDPQPGHMRDYVNLPDNDDGDYGGVHINSGIPNKAFYLAAKDIGGHAWEAPGHIWYESVRASNVTTDFQQFADTTFAKADQLYGRGSAEQQAVLSAWREVGVSITGLPPMARAPAAGVAPAEGEAYAALRKQIEALSTQVSAMAADVSALKKEKGDRPHSKR